MVVAAPDMGGSKRANAYSRFLKTEMVICYKLRKKANAIEEFKVIGDVRDRNIIVIDDMIDTAGTITVASNMMMEEGARSVRVVATHPVLSGPACERIENSKITEVVVTDTIPLKQQCSKIKVISIADIFADTINKVYNYQSISGNFII
jgi:ribose-phosphate pyrophosphokinase